MFTRILTLIKIAKTAYGFIKDLDKRGVALLSDEGAQDARDFILGPCVDKMKAIAKKTKAIETDDQAVRWLQICMKSERLKD